jgi:dTDP-glucose 4,6-dehydratase
MDSCDYSPALFALKQMRSHFALTRAAVYAGCVKALANVDLEHILEHTLPFWERARGRHIFLTGCTGFFGAWLLESMVYCNRRLDLDFSATILSRNPDAYAARMPHIAEVPCVRMHRGDVRTFEFPAETFDFVIHGAASSAAASTQSPVDLLSTIVDGTTQVLNFSKSRDVKSFLLISSGAVYGKQPTSISHIPESFLGSPDWLAPNEAYAEGKRTAESMCAALACESGIQFSIARCFAFTGPHLPLNGHFAIGNFIRDALTGRTITIHGDGTPIRSYLYAADLAIWLWTLLLKDRPYSPNPLPVNVGSGEAISIGELARVVASELCPERDIHTARQPVEDAAVGQYVPSVAKAEGLGLRQYVDLRDAIRRTAGWHR